MKQINLKEWTRIGAGGNGKTYKSEDESDVLLKVNNGEGAEYERVKREYDLSCAVRGMGIRTPETFEIVQVGKGYGTLFERIRGKKSLCRICADNPSRIAEMAALMSRRGRELHAVECTDALIRPAKEYALKGLEHFREDLTPEELKAVEGWIDALKDVKTCLHGDFNPGNLIVSGEGDWWIDLGRFSYGDPLLDVAHLYMFCNEGRDSWIVRKVIEHISHMKFSQLQLFWNAFLDAEGIEDKAGFEKVILPYLAMDKLVRHGFQHSDRFKGNVLRSIRKAMPVGYFY